MWTWWKWLAASEWERRRDFECGDHGCWCQAGWTESFTNWCWSTFWGIGPEKRTNIHWTAVVRRNRPSWSQGSGVRMGSLVGSTGTQLTVGSNQVLPYVASFNANTASSQLITPGTIVQTEKRLCRTWWWWGWWWRARLSYRCVWWSVCECVTLCYTCRTARFKLESLWSKESDEAHFSVHFCQTNICPWPCLLFPGKTIFQDIVKFH